MALSNDTNISERTQLLISKDRILERACSVVEKLPFTAYEERIDPYEEFLGPLVEKIPQLCRRERFPATVIDCYTRRLYAPEDVRNNWKYLPLDTGDVIYLGQEKGAKIMLAAKDLLFIDAESNIELGAAVINDDWDSIAGENVLSLTTKELDALYQAGYVRKRSGYEAENKVVEKVSEFFTRGKRELLDDYLKMVGEEAIGEKIMVYQLDCQQYRSPIVMRPFHLEAVGIAGSAVSNCRGEMCMKSIGRLIGVLPEFLEK